MQFSAEGTRDRRLAGSRAGLVARKTLHYAAFTRVVDECIPSRIGCVVILGSGEPFNTHNPQLRPRPPAWARYTVLLLRLELEITPFHAVAGGVSH